MTTTIDHYKTSDHLNNNLNTTDPSQASFGLNAWLTIHGNTHHGLCLGHGIWRISTPTLATCPECAHRPSPYIVVTHHCITAAIPFTAGEYTAITGGPLC